MVLSQLNYCGTKLAILGSDGLLSIWSSAPGKPAKLIQKFTTSSHLSAAPSCLLWSPDLENSDKDLLALGTEAGSVYVYSSSLTNLVLDKTVSGKVLSLCWSSNNVLYTGCDNGNVHILQLGSADSNISTISQPQLHTPVTSLAVHETLLAIGSRSIVLWDLKKKIIVKTLTGHANSVSQISFDKSGSWLLSSACHERVVSVWNAKKPKKSGSVATLIINDGVKNMELSDQEENNVLVSVVTNTGSLCVFRVVLKKMLESTIEPFVRVSIEDSNESSIPFTTSRIMKNSESVHVGYHSSEKVHVPYIEELKLSDLVGTRKITRQLQHHKQKVDDGGMEVLTPRTDKTVFLAPGPSLAPADSRSRKRGAGSEKVVAVEDRLSLLSTSSTSTSPARTDTLTQLLVQGLHSSDERILNSVLDRADLTLIDNTVSRLPPEAVLPLVRVLQKYIRGRGVYHASHAKWLKSVLSIHISFLVAVPDCFHLLSPVHALLEARTQNYTQVSQLRGKLEMMMKKTDEGGAENNVDTDKEALAFFQDESSDESDDMMSDLMIENDEEAGSEVSNTDDNDDSEPNDEEMESDSD